MLRNVANETYYDTQEILSLFGASKKLFYKNIQPQLQIYRFDGRRKPWYSEREVLTLKSGQIESEAPITISGILSDWTKYVRSLGFQVNTVNREISIVSLPSKAAAAFGIAPDRQFVMRSRISFVNQVPICIWASYYPLELVEGDIHEAMKHDEELDVVQRIKERSGLIITQAKDRYSARAATFEEQEYLRLERAEPVLILQRVSYTHDRMLVLYSHMTLLGCWFAPEHEYKVTNWSENE